MLPHTITEPGRIILSMRVTVPEVNFRVHVARLEKSGSGNLIRNGFL